MDLIKEFIKLKANDIGHQEVEVTGWKDTIAKSYKSAYLDGQKLVIQQLNDLVRSIDGSSQDEAKNI